MNYNTQSTSTELIAICNSGFRGFPSPSIHCLLQRAPLIYYLTTLSIDLLAGRLSKSTFSPYILNLRRKRGRKKRFSRSAPDSLQNILETLFTLYFNSTYMKGTNLIDFKDFVYSMTIMDLDDLIDQIEKL